MEATEKPSTKALVIAGCVIAGAIILAKAVHESRSTEPEPEDDTCPHCHKGTARCGSCGQCHFCGVKIEGDFKNGYDCSGCD